MRVKTTITLEKEDLDFCRENGFLMSKLLENKIKEERALRK